MTGRLTTGCDVVDVERLSAAIDRRPGFLERVFTPREVADARRGGARPGSEVERQRLAARFAAKEATRKALRELRMPFHDVEVRCLDDGAPQLWIRDAPSSLAVSLSHDAGVAMAVVVGEVDHDAGDPPHPSSSIPDAPIPDAPIPEPDEA